MSLVCNGQRRNSIEVHIGQTGSRGRRRNILLENLVNVFFACMSRPSFSSASNDYVIFLYMPGVDGDACNAEGHVTGDGDGIDLGGVEGGGNSTQGGQNGLR